MTRTEATDRLLREFPGCEVDNRATMTDLTFGRCKVRVDNLSVDATIRSEDGRCLWWTLCPLSHVEDLIGWLKEKVDA